MDVKQDLDHQDHQAPMPRRPRGFAAAAAAVAAMGEEGAAAAGAKGRKERDKEKERTKLRERHRRAITSRMLSGLRQYGNFPLPARADMNDVLAALAREAGWVVEADGTTHRTAVAVGVQPVDPPQPCLPPPAEGVLFNAQSVESPLSASTLKNQSIKVSLDCQSSILRIDETLSPTSLDSVVVMEGDLKDDTYANNSPLNSVNCVEADQMMQDMHNIVQAHDFSGTSYVPVYLMLDAGVINCFCQLVNPGAVRQELQHLKSLQIDGVTVECWWGIVEGWSPQKYIWSGYRDLFNIIREFKMKLQVVMAFNECHGYGPEDFSITLPKWVLEIGNDNQDVFFTDREGRRNTACLSWGIDKERILKGRTGIEVYFDFMRSFRMEFDDLFSEGLISTVEIGLGTCGELKYPSFSERIGWAFPGIGEFQCYDKYLQQSLRRAAKSRGHSFWARGPDNAGHYNSHPHETGFFCDHGDYDSYYGRFFLNWYAQTLIDHADNVLSLANLAFEDTQLIVKIPAIHWWYRTPSHAAELTAGFYNPTNRDGYCSIFDILKKHSVTVKLICSGASNSIQENNDALADPEGLSWQILNSAWDRGLTLAGQNSSLCHGREDNTRILNIAKPRDDPDRRHFSFFVYQLPPPMLPQRQMCLSQLNSFVRHMHGEVVIDNLG